MSERPHPPALPHGAIHEVFPDVFFVTGTMRRPGLVPVRFSRNMTIIREGNRLIVVNSVRLDEEGLRALDALGEVTDVVKIAAQHGMDDPFYRERYRAKVWSVKGQRYASGFTPDSPTYFDADAELSAGEALPIAGVRLHVIASKPQEGILSLEREGGILIAGDALQNFTAPDQYFNLPGKLILRQMGFLKPHNVGPAWLRFTKPPLEDLRALLSLEFQHLLPAHGVPVQGNARERYRTTIDALSRART